MELNEYQQKAMTTCMPSCDNFAYMMLNLVGELGEFASKVAKAVRKETLAVGFSEDDDEANENNLVPTCSWFEWDELKSGLRMEAGDILWQLSGLCHVMGWDLEDVAIENLGKLEARKKAGTIDGDGDGIIR